MIAAIVVRLTLVLACLCAATDARAQTYRAMLGDRVLGSVTYSETGSGTDRTHRMFTNLDNTPLGVGDGTFEAISRPATDNGAPVRQYTGVSKSARDGRAILFVHAGGAVRRTEVSPPGERTSLSDPSQVPGGVIDLAQAFARLARSAGCPAPFRFYDGRRVIDVQSLAPAPVEGGLACTVDYRVVAGPGHLSPFRFKRLRLDLTYDGAGVLAGAIVRAGPFSLRLTR